MFSHHELRQFSYIFGGADVERQFPRLGHEAILIGNRISGRELLVSS